MSAERPEPGRAVYLVLEYAWGGPNGALKFRTRDARAVGRLVRAFADRGTAEAFRREHERQARAGMNPFRYLAYGPRDMFTWSPQDCLEGQTSMAPGPLRDWLLDADLNPPEPEPADPPTFESANRDARAWIDWWEREAPGMTDAQRAKVWEALDKVRFFVLVERDLPGG